MSLSAYPFPLEHLEGSQGQDLEIQPQRPVIHIPHIPGELLFSTHGGSVVDLHLCCSHSLDDFTHQHKRLGSQQVDRASAQAGLESNGF